MDSYLAVIVYSPLFDGAVNVTLPFASDIFVCPLKTIFAPANGPPFAMIKQ